MATVETNSGSVTSNRVTQGLMAELGKEKAALLERREQLRDVAANYQVALRRYAAIRDMVIEHLGRSPYDLSDDSWPPEYQERKRGEYRYIYMQPGDAIIQVLTVSKVASGLKEIGAILQKGGFGVGPESANRVINAALTKTKVVSQTEDGTYFYEEDRADAPPTDGDDLPW